MTYTCLHEKGANNIQCPHTLQRFPTYIEEQGFLYLYCLFPSHLYWWKWSRSVWMDCRYAI